MNRYIRYGSTIVNMDNVFDISIESIDGSDYKRFAVRSVGTGSNNPTVTIGRFIDSNDAGQALDRIAEWLCTDEEHTSPVFDLESTCQEFMSKHGRIR